MEYTYFPSMYEQKKKEELQKLDETTNKKLSEDLYTNRKKFEETKSLIKKPEIPTLGSVCGSFAIKGAIIVFVLVIFLAILDAGEIALENIFILPLGGAMYGPIVGLISYPFIKAKAKKRIARWEENQRNLNIQQSNVEEKIRQAAQELAARNKKAVENDVAQYKKDFESKAQELSIKFADSQLAQEVITLISSGFVKTIDAANRAAHIKQIIVPFEFSVAKNMINFNTGHYGFEEHRCKNLENAVEQLALAKAISSQVQLNIVMQKECDKSGTAYTIDIKFSDGYAYSYSGDDEYEFSKVSLSYSAPNGHYKAVQDW